MGRQLRPTSILQCPAELMDIAESIAVQDSVARGSAGLYEKMTRELRVTARQEE